MTMVDHLVVAVPDLAAAVDEVAASTGVRPQFGGAHEGLGTHNALLSLGSCYLELIAADPAQPDAPSPRPFDVERFAAATLVTFAVRPDAGSSMQEVVATARGSGHDPGDPIDMHRVRPDGERLEWRLTLPPAAGPNQIPFVIDWGTSTSPADSAPSGVDLDSFEIRGPGAEERAALAALGVDARVVEASRPGLFARLVGPSGSLEYHS